MSQARIITLALCLLTAALMATPFIALDDNSHHEGPGAGPAGHVTADGPAGGEQPAGPAPQSTRDPEQGPEAIGGYWLDPFDGENPDSGTEYIEDVKFESGEVTLYETPTAGYELGGYMESVVIWPSNCDYWHTLRVQHVLQLDKGHSFKVTVMDGDYTPIPDFVDIDMSTDKFLDLTSLSAQQYEKIAIRGRLATEDQWTSPRILEWKVNWTVNQKPVAKHIEVEEDQVFRGSSISVQVYGKDKEDGAEDLTAVFESRPSSGGGGWSSVGFSNASQYSLTYNGLPGWYAGFTPPYDRKPGDYDIRAALVDSFGKQGDYYTVDEMVEVKNNPPSSPFVVIDPYLPGTLDDLFCNITVPSSDKEDPKEDITYQYLWVLDGVIQSTLTDPVIPADLTEKGQEWECRVTPLDNDGPGEQRVVNVTVDNTPPLMVLDPEDLEMDEDSIDYSLDLGKVFFDPDGDPVHYEIQNHKHCEFKILSNGVTVQITPDPDWHGVEKVILAATDNVTDSEVTNVPLNITVLEVNDPPDVEHLENQTVTQGEWFNMTLQASDRDSGPALYYSVNEVTAPAGFTIDKSNGFMSYHALNDHVGVWNIQVEVKDDEFEPTGTSFYLLVEDVNDPPTGVNITFPTDGWKFDQGEPADFRAAEAEDPDSEHGQTLNYTWYVDDVLISEEMTTNYRFDDDGVHEIRLVVSDGEYNITKTISVTVEPEDKGGTGGGGSSIAAAIDQRSLLIIIAASVAAVCVVIGFAMFLRFRRRSFEDKSRQEYEDMQIDAARRAALGAAMYGGDYAPPPGAGGPGGALEGGGTAGSLAGSAKDALGGGPKGTLPPGAPSGGGPGAGPGGEGFGSVKCFQCGAMVPIPSAERPVVVTCPECGTQGKISK